MDEYKVKGDMFQAIFDQVVMKWGRKGLETINARPGRYKKEQWYDFSEFCQFLADIRAKLGNNNPLTIYQLGFKTIKEDERWQGLFDKMNPENVFLSTTRQEGQYRVGTQTAESMGAKHVHIEFVSEVKDPIWFEFYRGRLQGVLELTGRTGVVHLMPWDGTANSRVFDIKWG